MTIGILKETQKGEKRVSISPKIAKALIDSGFQVSIVTAAGIAHEGEIIERHTVGVGIGCRK